MISLENSFVIGENNLNLKLRDNPFLKNRRVIKDIVKLTLVNYLIPQFNYKKSKIIIDIKYYDNLKRKFFPYINLRV